MSAGPPPRRLRWAMVGGGAGSTIGDSHRRAARYDDRFALVAGVVKRQRATDLVFAVTCNYTGYVMVRHARDLLAGGELGPVRLVQVEFASGWAATLLEAGGHRQASWRTDPASGGASAMVADLGTHAQHLAEFVTGLRVQQVAADLCTLVPGRTADDNAHVLLRFPDDVRGLLWVTMAAAGQLHGLRLRVYAERGGLEWAQEWPNELAVRPIDGPQRMIARGSPEMLPTAARATRMRAGHPEGFAAAFGTTYDDAWSAITARRRGDDPRAAAPDLPTVEDGARSVRFVDAVVASHRAGTTWVDIAEGVDDTSGSEWA